MRQMVSVPRSPCAGFAKSYHVKAARPLYLVGLARLRRIVWTRLVSSSIRKISLPVKLFVRCINRLVRLTAGDSSTTLIQIDFGWGCADVHHALTPQRSFARRRDRG